ncbi:AcrR family transcriptional regulator [Allocatelliglobosispora scoriae]|uniref:AcrR family transcriptional regulator n=1 Tax=Allocatelliglobosispora scoriae TaxID=643052 RepID=A0A841BI86_9ACTN|nr:TetR/AcrR family transcriptional regulator [Allocatelliglobosispora scoriae]MBB5867984.1 AcrR family transcriptional regulator [Allocatelliglobosispora scoriae]
MSGKSELVRSLGLLWGAQTKPGRSGLTVRAIVTAAMELADAEGLEAAAMRRVAERLGVGTMSLYTHVPGKSELTDLMFDTALSELYTGVEEPSAQPGGWRGGLAFIARRNWDLYQRHPWLLQLSGARPVLGPHTMLKYEAELRPLDGIGLTDVEMDSSLTLVLTHVEGVARVRAALHRDQQGLSEQEWWLTAAPVLEQVMDDRHFPVAARVGSASGEQYQASADPAHAFAFGLDRILDGIERLIEANAQEKASTDQSE